MEFKENIRKELANHLNEVITLKGEFAHYNKTSKQTTFENLINVDTSEYTQHINVIIPWQRYYRNNIYYITGVVTVYRDKENEELYDFGLKLVTVD